MKSYITTGPMATRIGPPVSGPEPEIGDTLKFIPHALIQMKNASMALEIGKEVRPVTGTCVSINRRARWARYEYDQPGGGKAWECFKY